MPRYKLTIEYDGSPFAGWQMQDRPTVQGRLTEAIKALSGDDMIPRGAGSTDAGFSAKTRHYRYRILNRRSPPALERDRVWHVIYGLDAAAMHEAAQVLVG